MTMVGKHGPGAREPAWWLLPIAGLCVALFLLGPALAGRHDFLPQDLRIWPPWSLDSPPEAAAARRAAGNLDVPEKTFLVLPDLARAGKSLAEGELPLWNPEIRTGAPLLAHSLHGLLYPPHWLLLAMRPGGAFAWLALAAFAAAGLCTGLLLRSWGIAPAAAAAGGLCFAFSGQMTANTHFYMRQDTLVLLPAVLLAFERWRLRGGAGALAGMALALAGLWLAGFPPYAVTALLALLAWAALKLPGACREKGRREGARLLLGTGFALAAGLALAGPQLAPLAAYLPWSQRTLTAPGADPRTWGADPAVLLTSLVPGLFGSPEHSGQVDYLHSPMAWLLFLWTRQGVGLVTRFNFTETLLYVGALPLLLAAWGALRPWPGRRGPLLALGAGALGLALGLEGGVLSGWIPGLRAAAPLRLLPIPVLVLALFAGRGLDRLLAGQRPPLAPVLAGLAVALGLGAAWLWTARLGEHGFPEAVLDLLARKYRDPQGLPYTPEHIERVFLHRPLLVAAWHHLLAALAQALPWWAAAAGALALLRAAPRARGPWGGLLLGLLALADLAALAAPLCPSAPRLDPFAGTELHAALDRERERLAPLGGATLARVGPAAGAAPTLLPPNLPAGMGIRDLQAYAFVDRRSHEPLAEALRRAAPDAPGLLLGQGPWIGALPAGPFLKHPLLDLYGVTHLLAARREAAPDLEALLELSGPGGALTLFRRGPAARRARVVPVAIPLGEEETLARMADPGFRPDAIAFLPPGSAEVSGPGGGEIRFLYSGSTTVRLEVTGGGGGLLVLADTFAPGWKAFLDGREAPLLRANHCFRGVALPPGDHSIEFRLSARPFGLGLGLLGLGALLLAGAAWLGRRRPALLRPEGGP